jgi:hypothetical protein
MVDLLIRMTAVLLLCGGPLGLLLGDDTLPKIVLERHNKSVVLTL